MTENGTNVASGEPIRNTRLRLWPGVVIVIVQWLLMFVVPVVLPGPDAVMVGVFGGLVGGVAVAVWWAFFSRAPRVDRWGAIIVMIVALVGTPRFVHKSIAEGMMGLMFLICVVPVISLAFVAWAVAGRHLPDRPRRATMAPTDRPGLVIVRGCRQPALYSGAAR